MFTSALADVADPGVASVGMAPTALAGLLLAGVGGRLLWLGVGLARLSRLRRDGEAFADRHGVVAQLEVALGTHARWIVCDGIGGPATYGVRRPVVLLPRALADGDPDLLRMVACHELVHVRRRDWLLVVVEECLRAALWFHPCIWLMLSRVHLHREQVVDHQVIAMLGDRDGYAHALIDGLARGWTGRARMAPAWVNARHLRARVVSIARGGTMSRLRGVLSAVALTSVLGMSAWWGSQAFPLHAQAVEGRVYSTSDGIVLPKLVSSVRPAYTDDAKKAKIQGEVVLALVVKTDGSTADVAVVKSLDSTFGLDGQAIAAARQWRFEPGTKDGAPVNVRVEVQMRFTLK
jgi:TonB family protein